MCVETIKVRQFKDMKKIQIEHKKKDISVIQFWSNRSVISKIISTELKRLPLSIRQSNKYS